MFNFTENLNLKSSFNLSFHNFNFLITSEEGFLKGIEEYCNDYIHNRSLSDCANNHLYKITLLLDPNLYQEINKYLGTRTPLKSIEFFRNEYLNKFIVGSERFFLFEHTKQEEDFPIVLKNSNHITLIYKIKPLTLGRILLRIIREILIREMESKGSLLFHASAVQLHNNGLLIVGHKGSGKTSLMAHLLSLPKARFLANDRAFISLENEIEYLPLPIRFSKDSFHSIKSLHNFSKSILSRSKFNDCSMNLKIEMTPQEIANAFKCDLSSSCNLKALLIPEFKITNSPCTVKRIAKPEIENLLRMSCFTPFDENWKEPWLVERNQPIEHLQEHAERRIQQIIKKVEIVKVHFGPHDSSEKIFKNLQTIFGDF